MINIINKILYLFNKIKNDFLLIIITEECIIQVYLMQTSKTGSNVLNSFSKNYILL